MFDIDAKAELFAKDLAVIVNNITNEFSSLLSGFPTTAGAFNSLDFTATELANFNSQLLATINDSGYNQLVGKYIGDSREYLSNRLSTLRQQYPQLQPLMAGIALSDLDNILLVNAEEFSLITQDIAMGIQSRLTSMILGGESLKDATKELERILSSNLTRYSETWLRTSYQRYIQQSEDLLAQKVGFGKSKDDVWDYIGAPLQKNSHKECIWALKIRKNSLFTTKEKKAFENGNAFASQPSPPRYNCQHYFIMSSRSLKKIVDRLYV